MVGMGSIFQEMGRNLTPSPLFSTGVLGVSLITLGGSDVQKQNYLPSKLSLLYGTADIAVTLSDQLKILKYDNVLTGQYKSNIDIGIVPKLKFDQEILKYSYMWKEGGQYSK